jgi:hypothetical protein
VLGPSAPADGLELVDDRGRAHRDPAVVLVSNNPYSFDPPHAPGTRPTLDAVIATAPVRAGIDGEAIDLGSPLWFVIRTAALRVRLPRALTHALWTADGMLAFVVLVAILVPA